MPLNALEIINAIIVTVGLPTILFAAIYIGRKLQILDWLKQTVETIVKDIGEIYQRIATIEGKLSGGEGGKSPLQPTDLGRKWLKESGLEKIIKDDKETFITELKKRLKELSNSSSNYDIQEEARGVMEDLEDTLQMKPIKDYAYKSGQSASVILRLGGLLLRDHYLKKQEDAT